MWYLVSAAVLKSSHLSSADDDAAVCHCVRKKMRAGPGGRDRTALAVMRRGWLRGRSAWPLGEDVGDLYYRVQLGQLAYAVNL